LDVRAAKDLVNMKLQYNSPVVLTYALIATGALIANPFTGGWLMETFFTIYPVIDLANPLWYLRLFSHVIGHGNWPHLVGNFTFILLIGPILEEKYGSKDLLLMMVVTALVTGLLHIFFFQNGLLGASGVVFMLILLSSYTNAKGGIPLTFVLIVLLFLGREVIESVRPDQVSQFAHIIGGIMGGLFGNVMERGRDKGSSKSTSS
jgi:membrane associated rhomboid family serine protease